MEKKSFYRKCHQTLSELSEHRQMPFIEKETQNRLFQDNAISKNGLYAAITPKGDELFKSEYYLELAEKVEHEERDRELRERDSLMNQFSVEKADEQNKINKGMKLFTGIAAIGAIITALATLIALIFK